MKKTFKKNILKNNKYNFKTELLLSALALLVGFGTSACKKDNVKPKNNTENPVNPVDPVDSTKNSKDSVDTELENAKKAYELAKDDSINAVNNIRDAIEKELKDLAEANKGKVRYDIEEEFYSSTTEGLRFPSFKDTVAGTNFEIVDPEPNVSYSYIKTEIIGYLGGTRKMLEIEYSEKDLELIRKIFNLSNQYLDMLPFVEKKRVYLDSIKGTRSK